MLQNELYIILSDRCNFACTHCLNASGPSAQKWDATDKEIFNLIEQVNLNLNIKAINFSGGEPTLKLRKISEIQAGINRSLRYTLTTNGWFWKDPESVLSAVKLDELVISYDKFHVPFNSKENVLKLATYAQHLGIFVTINLVFEQLDDLADSAFFTSAGINVALSRLVQSGRERERIKDSLYHDTSAVDRSCPSIDPEQRRNSLEKTVYLGNKGFTSCCGPLAFENYENIPGLFVNKVEKIKDLPIRNIFEGRTIRQIAQQAGLELENIPFQSVCDACSFLFAPVQQGMPSLHDISSRQENTFYLPSSNKLKTSVIESLQTKFIVGFTYTADPKDWTTSTSDCSHENIKPEEVTNTNYHELVEFMITSYYKNYPNHYSSADIASFRNIVHSYSKLQLKGFLYKKSASVVGAIITNSYQPHPALLIPTLHIGYWGYSRELVTISEARSIKNHWRRMLSDFAGKDQLIDCSVDWFNEAGLNFANTLNFKQRCVRFDRKS